MNPAGFVHWNRGAGRLETNSKGPEQLIHMDVPADPLPFPSRTTTFHPVGSKEQRGTEALKDPR